MICFFRAIWFPLILSFYCLFLLIFSLHEADWHVFIPAGALMFVFAVDVVGRASEYFYLRKYYNPDHKILFWKAFQSSRCAREVMCTIDPDAKLYYYEQGYRWYHFVPDDPLKFFNLQFWKNLIGPRKIRL